MPPKKKKGGTKKKGTTKKVPLTDDIVLPSIVSEKTSTLLYTVVTSDIPTLSRLIKHYNYEITLQDTDINGSTPLHISCKKGDVNMVRHLLGYSSSNGTTTTININALEKTAIGGYSALHNAIIGTISSSLSSSLSSLSSSLSSSN